MSNKVKNETTWRIEAKKTHMVNHVIKICDVILGPHNVRNGSYSFSVCTVCVVFFFVLASN